MPGEYMDLQALSAQFSGRKFGELVLHHYKSMKQDVLVPALVGNIESLPASAQPLTESWIDEVTAYGTDVSFWQSDAGQTFTRICNAARQRFADAGILATDDDVFAMFQIILLNFVYGLHKHPQSKAFIQRSIGMSFLRRMFG